MDKVSFDENFAPKGFKAVLANHQKGSKTTCRQCWFYETTSCTDQPCCEFERPDKCSVIFVKKED